MLTTPTTIVPVILSGGAGTRLWPASREALPKPFIKLLGDLTMFESTLRRVADRRRWAEPVIIANSEHRFLIAEALRQADMSASILLEPERRDSGAAIAAAAAFVAERNKDAVMMVLPADHAIGDAEAFGELAESAVPAARAGHIVTFGLKPDHPATGYGYIRPDGGLVDGIRRVAAFVEKPDAETAAGYVSEGYLWNSGMFMMAAAQGLAEIDRLQPEIAASAMAAVAGRSRDLDFLRLAADPWRKAPRISFDHAVMERTDKAAVLEAGIDWSDIGTWKSVWEASPKDESGNATLGAVHLRDTSDSYVRSDRLLVGLIGMHNVMVVATDDAILVSPIERADEVKQLVDDLGRRNRQIIVDHSRVHRPWGFYESVDNGGRHQVKRICVKPGARLSLQKHHHRSEHWVVVAGTAEVTRGDRVETVYENESVYIPSGTVHRLANPGKILLELIEVQSGSYLGEDDIVRLEDDYDRTKD
jgi:mannose-1-phosphate guanylyltransferase/mannose-6-phosphate isomerase